MKTFALLFRHNAWANDRIIVSLGQAPAELLGPPGDGRNGTTAAPPLQRLQHQLFVERGFLDALNGVPRMPQPPVTLDAMGAYSLETAEGFAALCGGLEDEALDRLFQVPWWERDFPVRTGLLQPLSHSGQHRAELAWILAGAGIDTGNLDYIVWAANGQPAPGDPWPPAAS